MRRPAVSPTRADNRLRDESKKEREGGSGSLSAKKVGRELSPINSRPYRPCVP
jgi:hypothetical protein